MSREPTAQPEMPVGELTQLIHDRMRAAAEEAVEAGAATLSKHESIHPSTQEWMADTVNLDPTNPSASPVHVQVTELGDVQAFVGREGGFIALWDEDLDALLNDVQAIVEAAIHGRVHDIVTFDDGSDRPFSSVNSRVFDAAGNIIHDQIYYDGGRDRRVRERAYESYR